MVLANEDRTGDYLPAAVNLTFASEKWLRTVLVQTDKGPKLARRHFEVCVFAALAAALKAGDVAVEGSDAYADYREQLLPWAECEPQVADYSAYAGAAPVTRASGKKLVVLHRKVKNQRLAAVGYLWTFAALRLSTGARAHYDRRRVAGDRHAAAERHLFNRFLGCLYYCLQTGQAYAEDQAFPSHLPVAA